MSHTDQPKPDQKQEELLARIFGGVPADYASPKKKEIETEADWQSSTDSGDMLYLLQPRVTQRRKPLLFGVACCRRIWHRITDPLLRRVVDLAEKVADSNEADREYRKAARAIRKGTEGNWTGTCWETVCCLAYRDGHPIGPANGVNKYGPMASCGADDIIFTPEGQAIRKAEQDAYVPLIREVFGNPFRPVTVDPAWLTSDVRLLATGVYDEKAFDRMPILADALQDAGCDNDDILNHLRDTGATHVRGCWALDLVLGKE